MRYDLRRQFPWYLTDSPDRLQDLARELLAPQPAPSGGTSFALTFNRPDWVLWLSSASYDRLRALDLISVDDVKADRLRSSSDEREDDDE